MAAPGEIIRITSTLHFTAEITIRRLLTNLLEDIRQHVGCLFQLSADVAELDLALSLAQISCNPEYVRPSFAARLELRNSLHPIMELFNTDLPVPNDVVRR